MAIYKPDEIKNMCTSLWHVGSPKIELTNPKKDGMWHISPADYHLLLAQADCKGCEQESKIDWSKRSIEDQAKRDDWNAKR